MPDLLPGRAAVLAGAALTLGILADALLRTTPWGVNAVIVGLCFGAAALYALRAAPLSVVTVLVLGEACLSMLLWRDALFLQVWGVLAFLAALALLTACSVGVSLPAMRIRDGVAATVESGLRAAGQGWILFSRDVSWERLRHSGRARDARAIVAGVLLAVPIVLVFGTLLRAAEPQFEARTEWLLAWNLPSVMSHMMLAGVLTWLAAGYLHGLAAGRRWIVPPPEAAVLPRLRLAHVGIPLATLAVMLLLFAVIQAEYLFGGAETVLRTTGLTVAEHARRGFFELVAVAALVLGLLLVSNAVIDPGDRSSVRGVRVLSILLIGLVGVVMTSAIVRMQLYVRNFGLSEDRIYASAFMLWVCVTLAWFALTVLRGVAARFAHGAVIAGFATLLTLGALDPHALIVRTNVARAAEGHDLDTAYLSRLSADAVPAIVAALPTLDEQERCALWHVALGRWIDAPASDWRTWNSSRRRAARAVATMDPEC